MRHRYDTNTLSLHAYLQETYGLGVLHTYGCEFDKKYIKPNVSAVFLQVNFVNHSMTSKMSIIISCCMIILTLMLLVFLSVMIVYESSVTTLKNDYLSVMHYH
ncbi:Uncharacterised protein r2_g2470 [Pycnogonum litorale]